MMGLPVCPYCKKKARLTDDLEVYGPRQSFGKKMYVCTDFPKCDTYVGCHPKSDEPLGEMANKELRDARIKAHRAFDRLWKLKAERENLKPCEARQIGYRWLSFQMDLEVHDCHMAKMTLEQCLRVVEVCRPVYVWVKS